MVERMSFKIEDDFIINIINYLSVFLKYNKIWNKIESTLNTFWQWNSERKKSLHLHNSNKHWFCHENR